MGQKVRVFLDTCASKISTMIYHGVWEGSIGGEDTRCWLPLLLYSTITFRHHWIPLLNFQHSNASWHLKRCSRHLPSQQKIPDEIPVRNAVRKIMGAGSQKSNVHACASEGFILRNDMPFIPLFISHFLVLACIMRYTRLNSKCAGILSFCAGHLEFVEIPHSPIFCLSCLRRLGRLRYPWVFGGERRRQASSMSSPTQNVTSSPLCCFTLTVKDTLKG